MKKTVSAAALLMLCAAPAFAQATAEQLSAMDANGDKMVNSAEFVAFADKAFASMDADSNGSVAQAEAGARIPAAQFTAVDANRNGSISKAEFDAAAKADFAASDLDKNGMLD